MRAAVLAAPRHVEMTTVAVDPVREGTVRIAVDGCGVCGSNLPVWQGRPWFRYPLEPGAPGHEAWGRVVECDGATGVQPGDAVAFLADSAFAEIVCVPANVVVRLPVALAGRPFPGEALGCCMNIVARSGITRGCSVCIVGVGFLGAVITAVAVDAGAHVVAVTRRAFAREIGTAMGAAAVVPLDDTAERAALDANEGRLFDVVVEAVGTQASLDVASRLVTTRGRLVIAGYHQDGARSVDMQLWNWRGIDVVNAHERDDAVRLRGITAAADAVAAGRLDPAPLYTHTFPLDRLADAMTSMEERPDGFLKALVVA